MEIIAKQEVICINQIVYVEEMGAGEKERERENTSLFMQII